MKNHWLRNKRREMTLQELADGGCCLDLFYEWQYVQNEQCNTKRAPAKTIHRGQLNYKAILPRSLTGTLRGGITFWDHQNDGKLFITRSEGESKKTVVTDECVGSVDYDSGTLEFNEGWEGPVFVSYEYNYAENN